ncbi:MAG: bifunctional phosphoribosyl-AMP cyclohydrolase/phosphoribosyl-ATP diphosphatase HisIE [Nitrospira sp.]|nr:bifunctional phosphoribosyl-AMP cyclohydrolase/phosphoribosyl-ATP diphosphatase HisIE [Nitrospira sp.]
MKKKSTPGSIFDNIKFDKSGLIPTVIQDATSGDVLMMAYMNRKSLEKTLKAGITHFWSRSRKRLWQKGESSGNIQRVKSIHLDCDQDALLVRVDQTRVACHTGQWSCFHQQLSDGQWVMIQNSSGLKKSPIVDRVYQIILDRKKRPREDSYVSSLLKMGKDRILRKIGEESGELIIGSKNDQKSEIISEMADLWFHTLVLLGYHGITPQEIYQELEQRHGKSGLKRSRPTKISK